MSVLIHLLIFFILPYSSTSSYSYGIIRNASIKLPFTISDTDGHKSTVKNCTECLCDAFSNPKVVLLTCTRNESMDFMCQFYYFMPKLDEIEYPRNDTDIYLIQNKTFGEKDDCCNTTYLLEKINNATRETDFFNRTLRFLVRGDNNMILSTFNNTLLKFDRTTLQLNSNHTISGFQFDTVGYDGKKYYLAGGNYIKVYNETLTSSLDTISVASKVTTIRFLNETQMLVGTHISGGYIFKRNNNTDNFQLATRFSGTKDAEQLHAIGILNESAFYAGWYSAAQNLSLYTKDDKNVWIESTNDRIIHREPTSDIFIDNCKRVWVVIPDSNKIFIYDQNKTGPYEINVTASTLFNLLILDNYTLVTSHEFNASEPQIGLTRIQPSLNCRPPLKK